MDNHIRKLQIQVIKAHSDGLGFDQFFIQLAPTGVLPERIFYTLEAHGFGRIPEAAVNVFWQATLGAASLREQRGVKVRQV